MCIVKRIIGGFLLISILFATTCQIDKYNDDDLFKIKMGKYYGFIDKSGNMIIEPKFNSCGIFSEGLAYARVDSLMGFINYDGEFEIKFINTSKNVLLDNSDTLISNWKEFQEVFQLKNYIPFESSDAFYDSTRGYKVKKRNTNSFFYWDVMKNENNMPPITEIKFKNGLAPFYDNGTYKFGYINTDGKYVIPPKFATAFSFKEGLALVKIDSVYKFIDGTGNYAFIGAYDEARSFSSGKAICKNTRTETDTAGMTWYSSNTMIINTKGEILDVLGYITVNDFHENIATIVDIAQLVMTDRGTTFIDSNFNRMLKGYLEDARYFSEGLAPFKINNLWGFVNNEMGVVIEPKYENAFSFACGLAPVKIDGLWGFIDKADHEVIKPKYDTCFNYHNGLAYVKSSRNEFIIEGYIDKTGKYIWHKERH